MKHLIPFRPLFNLIYILLKYKGISPKKWSALLPWVFKTIILEPFRWLEAVIVICIPTKPSTQEPIFILGYYRSGTTWLQELMASNPSHSTPTIFQTIVPESMLLLEPILKPILQFFVKKKSVENKYHRLPFDWNFPGEDDVALNTLSNEFDFNRIYQYPSYGDTLLNDHFVETTPRQRKIWQQNHQYFIKKQTLRNGSKRLILKSPPNTGRIHLLKELYPNAKFIYISRKADICKKSNLRLWDLNKPFSFENYSTDQIKVLIDKMYNIFEEQYQVQKTILKANELVEIEFDNLIQNPQKTIELVYNKLQINYSTEAQERANQLINSRKDYQSITE